MRCVVYSVCMCIWCVYVCVCMCVCVVYDICSVFVSVSV